MVAKIIVSGLPQGPVEVASMQEAFELMQSEEFFRATHGKTRASRVCSDWLS
jgi:hypothetical protein